MPIFIRFITPHANEEVGRNISVTGTTRIDEEPGGSISIDSVTVQFGVSGPVKSAGSEDGWENWSCSGTAPALGGAPVRIMANVKGKFTTDGPNPRTVPRVANAAVDVKLEATPPELTIEPFSLEVTPPTLPYRLSLRGMTRDVGSGVASVQFRIGDGAFANVDNLSGDWTQWAKDIDLPAGEHHLTIQATDRIGNSQSQSFVISVRTPFEPTDVEQVFAPTTYLRELLGFATRQIKIGATATGPTAQVLANRFFQPFDKLTVGKAYEQAVLPVHQARIAVEVLRHQIQPTEPPEIDQRFRSVAYQALVRELGTSHEELRLARVAEYGDPAGAGGADRYRDRGPTPRSSRSDDFFARRNHICPVGGHIRLSLHGAR